MENNLTATKALAKSLKDWMIGTQEYPGKHNDNRNARANQYK